MKHLIAMLVCALAATALARPDINTDAAKQSGQKIKIAHEKCQADTATAVDEEALNKLGKGGEAPANLGPHTLCMAKALGWQNEDGTVNRANIEAGATSIFGNKTEFQQQIDECTVAQATPEETAIHIFKCYRKYAPRTEGATTNPHH